MAVSRACAQSAAAGGGGSGAYGASGGGAYGASGSAQGAAGYGDDAYASGAGAGSSQARPYFQGRGSGFTVQRSDGQLRRGQRLPVQRGRSVHSLSRGGCLCTPALCPQLAGGLRCAHWRAGLRDWLWPGVRERPGRERRRHQQLHAGLCARHPLRVTPPEGLLHRCDQRMFACSSWPARTLQATELGSPERRGASWQVMSTPVHSWARGEHAGCLQGYGRSSGAATSAAYDAGYGGQAYGRSTYDAQSAYTPGSGQKRSSTATGTGSGGGGDYYGQASRHSHDCQTCQAGWLLRRCGCRQIRIVLISARGSRASGCDSSHVAGPLDRVACRALCAPMRKGFDQPCALT